MFISCILVLEELFKGEKCLNLSHIKSLYCSCFLCFSLGCQLPLLRTTLCPGGQVLAHQRTPQRWQKTSKLSRSELALSVWVVYNGICWHSVRRYTTGTGNTLSFYINCFTDFVATSRLLSGSVSVFFLLIFSTTVYILKLRNILFRKMNLYVH